MRVRLHILAFPDKPLSDSLQFVQIGIGSAEIEEKYQPRSVFPGYQSHLFNARLFVSMLSQNKTINMICFSPVGESFGIDGQHGVAVRHDFTSAFIGLFPEKFRFCAEYGE